jgi:predicted TIM-barrel fold metal-dependent hydrolase
MQLIDTHLHLILRKQLGYAWTADIPQLAQRNFTVEDYIADCGATVSGAIYMESGVDDTQYRDETRLVAGLVADASILGHIASCRPEEPGLTDWLDECAELGVTGFRRILHVVDDRLSLGKLFREGVREIGRRGYSFDLCLRADQHAIYAALLHACPDQQFILDHCGNPDIANDAFSPWADSLARLAAFPHLALKLSGITANARPDQQRLDTFRIYVETVLECFGPERIVWGSDWPVCNTGMGLPRWIETTRALLEPLSAHERECIGQLNARRIYLKEPENIQAGSQTV